MAASRLLGRHLLGSFCLCCFFKIIGGRRAIIAWLAQVLLAAVGDAFLLGVNIGIKTGLFCSHDGLSTYEKSAPASARPGRVLD